MVIKPQALMGGLLIFIAACSPMIQPQDTPRVLRDAVADGYFAFDAGEICDGLATNEAAYEDRLEDILVQMIEAGYSSDQFVAMLDGLDFYDDWAFPYLVAFERKHEIDVDDDAAYCRALTAEKESESSIGKLLE